MATKTKSTAQPARPTHGSTLPKELDDAFTHALKLLDAGKLAEARTALEALHEKSEEAGNPAFVHAVRARLEALRQRLSETKDSTPPALLAQVHLTRQEDKAALDLLEKAVVKEAGKAPLHYLHSIALLRADRLEESAAALAKAVERDPDLRYTYFLEPEFDDVRRMAPFVRFETA